MSISPCHRCARWSSARLVAFAAAVGWTALLNACGVLLPSRGPKAPSPAESLLAVSALKEVVDQYVSHEQQERFDLRVRIGAPLDRIPEFSERNAREDARFARAMMRRLDRITADALEEADYLTLLSIRSALQGSSDHALYYANDLTLFSAGSPLGHITRMMAELPLRDSRDVERYVFLLYSLAPFADTLRADLVRRAAQGIFLEKAGVARADSFFALFEAPSSRSVLRVTAERAKALDSGTARRFIAVTDSSIDGMIVPAFKRLTTFLRAEHGAKGPMAIGLWQYVGGKEYYRALVRRMTTLEVTPEQVHDAGLRDVARLDTAMRAQRLRMGASVAADSFHDALRRDVRFRAVTPNEVVDQVLLAQSALPVSAGTGSSFLGFYPVVVAANDAWESGDAIFGWYRQPSGVDTVGQYTPGSAVRSPGLSILLEPISYFALSPGRHDVLGQRLNPSLTVARWYANVPAFADGWGLYSLDVARERGALTDPFAAYGALMLEMIAAVRLTVDSGIHFFGWTAAQSAQFIRKYSMLDDAQAADEIARIAHDAPGLGLAAAMGVREIRGVRRWMERELKKDFDERRFNEELHSLGPVPLQALGPHFEWWLWKERTRIRDAAKTAKVNAKSGSP